MYTIQYVFLFDSMLLPVFSLICFNLFNLVQMQFNLVRGIINTMLSMEVLTTRHHDNPGRNRQMFEMQTESRRALLEYALYCLYQ